MASKLATSSSSQKVARSTAEPTSPYRRRHGRRERARQRRIASARNNLILSDLIYLGLTSACGGVPWLCSTAVADACEVRALGALADGAFSAPEGRHHIDTRDPVRARRRMAARMQLRAPLLRRAHSGTPSICVDSACQRPAPTAHPIQSARIRGEHRGHTELHSRSF